MFKIQNLKERLVSTSQHMQVKNGTGVHMSKRPMLACRTHCIYSIGTWNLVKG